MNKNKRKLLKSSIFRRPNYQKFAMELASLPIAFLMLVSASIAVAVLSEDAWSSRQCTTESRIGYETYNTGKSNNKLIVTCDEKTYVEGEGNVYSNFSQASGRTWLQWSVELDGNTPKRYVKGACTTAGRESEMCFKEQEGTTDAQAYGALDTTQVYWRLNTIDPSVSPVALTGAVGNEIPESGNENKFIKAAANKDNNGPLLHVLANTNGLEHFELVIKGERVTVKSNGRGGTNQTGNMVHLAAGGYHPPNQMKSYTGIQSYTVRVENKATVSSGRENADTGTFGVGGIFLGDAAYNNDSETTRWSGPLTVDISGGSTVESWASTTRGKHPRAVMMDVHKLNSDVATLKLTGSTLRIRHPAAPESWDERGKLKTNGRYSPGIQVKSVGGYGSVRVDTPLEIETYGDDSPGISVSFASSPDSLREATQDIVQGGVSWENVVWWTFGGGNNNEEKIFGADCTECDPMTGLTRDQIAGVFRGEAPPEVSGGALDRFWAGSTNTQNYPLSRMQVTSPKLYAKRAQIAEIIVSDAMRGKLVEYKTNWLLSGKSSHAAFIRLRNGSADAGIVYEIDDTSKITTFGENAAAIVADFFAETDDSRTTIRIDDGNDFQTDEKVEIDHDNDPDTAAISVFKTKIVVDEPVTTKGERSHGIWVMGMNGTSPLDERRYLASTTRDVEITANANISATGEGAYAIVLLGDEDRTNKINLRENAVITGGVYLGQGTNSITGTGTLSGAIMGTTGGTLTLNLEKAKGGSNIVLHENLGITGNIVLGTGDDTVTVKGTKEGGVGLNLGDGFNTVVLEKGYLSSMTGVNTLRKTTEGVATVRDIAFSGSLLHVRKGELRVSGNVDLGAARTAKVAVDDGAILTFVIPRDVTAEKKIGRISAAVIEFTSLNPDVRMEYEDSRDVTVTDARAASSLITAGTIRYRDSRTGNTSERPFRVQHTSDGETVEISSTQYSPPKVTRQPDQDPERPEDRDPQPSTADDDDNTGLYAAGAIAVLWWLMCETGAIGSMSDDGGNSCFGKSQWNSTGAVQYTNTGMNTWASLQSDKGINPVQGLAFGTNARVGENARIGFSAMPNASGTTGSLGASLNQSSSISGGLYSLQGEWGSDTGYASVALTHANLTAGTRFENIISGGGMLGGEFEMKQSHLQLTAGTKLDAGGVSWTPSLGLYGGSVDQDGYSASNAMLIANVPGYRQNYRGWKLGLRAESKERMSSSGGLRWHPGVSVDMYRTATSGPRSLPLNQTDRTGVFSLSDRMPVGGLPNRIVALRAGGTIEIPRAGEFRMDYVGMEMDGEIQHGALLKYQNRF